MRIDFARRIKETIHAFQIAYEADTGRKCNTVEIWLNPDNAKFLDIESLVDPGIPIITDKWWIGNNIFVVSSTPSWLKRTVIPDDWESFFDRGNSPPLYRCHCRRSLSPAESSPLSCICQGSGQLTWSEAIEIYGFIPHCREVPYCHLCLNQNRDELFPYSLFDFGEGDNSNVRFIYRCRHHHGHDKGWLLWDIFRGETVKL
jgi:hypothetical protein